MFKWTYKWTKRFLIAGVVLAGVSILCVKTGIGSYVRSSTKILHTAVKDSIPVEFEIQRARDLLEDLIPEMHANLRLVAAEEVDVANLEKEIQRQRTSVAREGEKVRVLRDTLRSQVATYTLSGREYRRSELVEEMARRFEYLKTAEMLLKGKEDLLRNRRRSLDAALQKLEKTRLARIELASQIEALEGQFRLIQAQSAGSEFHLDDSKLARTQHVIGELKKRLEIAQRVLAREAHFVEMIPIEPVSEAAIVDKVDGYLSEKTGPVEIVPVESKVARALLDEVN